MTREKLIAALEKAEAGSRELDVMVQWEVQPVLRAWSMVGLLDTNTVPTYTTSLDAALTLVPSEGFWWTISYSGGRTEVLLGDGLHLDEVAGRTPALALCLAALRLRASNA